MLPFSELLIAKSTRRYPSSRLYKYLRTEMVETTPCNDYYKVKGTPMAKQYHSLIQNQRPEPKIATNNSYCCSFGQNRKINAELTLTTLKNNKIVPDIATRWYHNQREKREQLMKYKNQRNEHRSTIRDVEAKYLNSGSLNPKQFKRISPEFLKILHDHETKIGNEQHNAISNRKNRNTPLLTSTVNSVFPLSHAKAQVKTTSNVTNTKQYSEYTTKNHSATEKLAPLSKTGYELYGFRTIYNASEENHTLDALRNELRRPGGSQQKLFAKVSNSYGGKKIHMRRSVSKQLKMEEKMINIKTEMAFVSKAEANINPLGCNNTDSSVTSKRIVDYFAKKRQPAPNSDNTSNSNGTVINNNKNNNSHNDTYNKSNRISVNNMNVTELKEKYGEKNRNVSSQSHSIFKKLLNIRLFTLKTDQQMRAHKLVQQRNMLYELKKKEQALQKPKVIESKIREKVFNRRKIIAREKVPKLVLPKQFSKTLSSNTYLLSNAITNCKKASSYTSTTKNRKGGGHNLISIYGRPQNKAQKLINTLDSTDYVNCSKHCSHENQNSYQNYSDYTNCSDGEPEIKEIVNHKSIPIEKKISETWEEQCKKHVARSETLQQLSGIQPITSKSGFRVTNNDDSSLSEGECNYIYAKNDPLIQMDNKRLPNFEEQTKKKDYNVPLVHGKKSLNGNAQRPRQIDNFIYVADEITDTDLEAINQMQQNVLTCKKSNKHLKDKSKLMVKREHQVQAQRKRQGKCEDPDEHNIKQLGKQLRPKRVNIPVIKGNNIFLYEKPIPQKTQNRPLRIVNSDEHLEVSQKDGISVSKNGQTNYFADLPIIKDTNMFYLDYPTRHKSYKRKPNTEGADESLGNTKVDILKTWDFASSDEGDSRKVNNCVHRFGNLANRDDFKRFENVDTYTPVKANIPESDDGLISRRKRMSSSIRAQQAALKHYGMKKLYQLSSSCFDSCDHCSSSVDAQSIGLRTMNVLPSTSFNYSRNSHRNLILKLRRHYEQKYAV